MSLTPRSRQDRGFTLLELMVVVALLGVVTAIAAPGMASFLSTQRVKGLTNDLVADLTLARSEALKRGTSVSVTPRTGGWSAGWTVASGGTDLSAREAINETLSLTGAPTAITFNLYGRVSSPSGAVRLTVASTRSTGDNAKRCVELDIAGRVRSKVGACA